VIALNSSLILAVPTGALLTPDILLYLKRKNKRDNLTANGITYSAVYCLTANKAIPVQAWKGPQAYRSLRLPDFKKIGTLRW
jgi:hypothetical protein